MKTFKDFKPQVIHAKSDWALHKLLFEDEKTNRRIAIEKSTKRVKSIKT